MTGHDRAYGDDERRNSAPLVRGAHAGPTFRPVLARIDTDNGDGSYQWSRLVPSSGSEPHGPLNGKAWEIAGTTGISLPKKALLFMDAGRWWFDAGSSSAPAGGGGAAGVYGDASDGNLTFSKADNLQPISYAVEITSFSFPPAANYGRSVGDWIHWIDRRILWCNNLTIDAVVVVIPHWFTSICTIFVDGVFTLNGELSVSGDDIAYAYEQGIQAETSPISGGGFAGVGLGGPGGSGNGVNGRGNDGPTDEGPTYGTGGSGAGDRKSVV